MGRKNQGIALGCAKLFAVERKDNQDYGIAPSFWFEKDNLL